MLLRTTKDKEYPTPPSISDLASSILTRSNYAAHADALKTRSESALASKPIKHLPAWLLSAAAIYPSNQAIRKLVSPR